MEYQNSVEHSDTNVELYERAAQVYQEAMFKYRSKALTPEDEEVITNTAKANGKFQSLRLGAVRRDGTIYAQAKLLAVEKAFDPSNPNKIELKFFISPNGMELYGSQQDKVNDVEFRAWEDFVASEFEKADLPFGKY